MTDLTMRELANIVDMKHLDDWQLDKKQTAKTIFIKFCKIKKVEPILDIKVIGYTHKDGMSLEKKLSSYEDKDYINNILQVAQWLIDSELPDDCQVIEVDFKRKEIIK